MKRHDWFIAVVIFVATVAALVLPSYALIRVSQVQRDVTCLNAEVNVATLKDIQQNGVVIRRTARELGLHLALPRIFEIPEVPPECVP